MNKRVEKLCGLCREEDKAYREYGALSIGGITERNVQLNSKAFFKYFDKFYRDEFFKDDEYVKFYRVIDDIYFFCLVEKGDVDDE